MYNLQVTNDSEWQEAIKVGSYQNYCNHPTVNLKATVSEVVVSYMACSAEGLALCNAVSADNINKGDRSLLRFHKADSTQSRHCN